MSKISELMDFLRRVIQGSDRSNTPQLHKAAVTYASACTEVAAKLDECRALIAAGLLVDAKSLDRSMTPTLSERARTLALTAEEAKVWNELCKLYGYPQAADIDVETVRRLSGAADEDGRDSGRLIMRWRKIARTGSHTEKIELLRRIIRAVPENNTIWRDNLRQVEQQFVSELLQEMPKVLRADDPAKIMKLFNLLSDPELSVKVPEEALSKLRPAVTLIQKEELAARLKGVLETITGMYSAMDEAGTREALAEYDKLASHPLHSPDPEEARQIREVRQYLENCRIQRENAAKAKRETAELVTLLNDNGPLDRINMLYESLRQLDLPLEKTLAERVGARREADALEAARRHQRRGLAAILLAVILLAAGAVTVIAFNMYSENRNTAAAWQKQLEEGNPAAVLTMYESLEKEKPRLLKFGKLRALQMEAEHQEEERVENEARVMALLAEAEKLAGESNVNLAELAKRVEELEKLPGNALDADAEKRLRRVATTLRTLELEAQQARDREFTKNWNELTARASAWEKKLRTSGSGIDELEKEFKEIELSGNQLFRAADDVSEKVRDARKENWESRRAAMAKRLADEGELRAFRRELTAPKDFRTYAAALDALPARLPQEAVGEWKAALAMLPVMRALALSAHYGSHWTNRDKLDEKARELQPLVRSTPFVEDLHALLPDHFAEQLALQRTELEKRLCNVPDCYELVAQDAEKKRYYFYSPEEPKLERKRSSPVPKSIRMDVFYRVNSPDTVPLTLRVQQADEERIELAPYNFTALKLPEEFPRALNLQMPRCSIPAAKHQAVVAELRNGLQSAASPEALEDAVLQVLTELQTLDEMNLLLRASLMRQLMDTLAVTSEFYRTLTLPIAAKLDAMALGFYEQWMVPDAEARLGAAEELRTYTGALDVAQLREARILERSLYAAALDRGVAPAGIVTGIKNHTPVVHWFAGSETCIEAWFPMVDEKTQQVQFFAVPRKALEQENALPAGARDAVATGMAVFAPYDGVETAKLAEQYVKLAREKGVSEVRWPESWPVNVRGGQGGGR